MVTQIACKKSIFSIFSICQLCSYMGFKVMLGCIGRVNRCLNLHRQCAAWFDLSSGSPKLALIITVQYRAERNALLPRSHQSYFATQKGAELFVGRQSLSLVS